jgi:hypothetical protein
VLMVKIRLLLGLPCTTPFSVLDLTPIGRGAMHNFMKRTGADELMITLQIFDHAANDSLKVPRIDGGRLAQMAKGRFLASLGHGIAPPL